LRIAILHQIHELQSTLPILMMLKLNAKIVGALGVTLSPIATPKTFTTGDWHLAHPYPMPPNFTGRAIELKCWMIGLQI